ncbi:hypothetical protein ACFTY8_05795 [Streptomyces mirabilis]|uniref:hypothetical protein n=1 Tax=Streptomyces mirabilis TaxID=68239 RepID=UPI00362EDB7C
MPMLLIEGDYRILNAKPDGDTVRFDPHDAAFWYEIPGPHKIDKTHRNSRGGADRFRILSQGPTAKTLTGLHHVVEVNGGTVRMTHPIEDLVFAEE